jgi:hypothetical protein
MSSMMTYIDAALYGSDLPENQSEVNKKLLLIGKYKWLGSTVTLLVCEDETYFEVRHEGPRINVESSVKFDEKHKAVELFYKYINRIISGSTNSDEWNYIQGPAPIYVEKS